MRKELGEQDRYPKKPMFAQDFEHILDNIGLETSAEKIVLHCMPRIYKKWTW